MAVKLNPNMYCTRCECPVAGVKNTHGARNTAAVLAAPFTWWQSLWLAKRERYFCPHCGGPVVQLRAPRRTSDRRRAPRGRQLYHVRCPHCRTDFDAAKGYGRPCPSCGYGMLVDPHYWPAVEPEPEQVA